MTWMKTFTIELTLLFSGSVNFFDYCGSIVSYAVVSIPLFTGEFDDLMPGELAAVISKVCVKYTLGNLRSRIDGST